MHACRNAEVSVHHALAELESEGPSEGEAATALGAAWEVVENSDSEKLRGVTASFEPQYMLAGGTSQVKDSLVMMLMGLPLEFQAGGIGTSIPAYTGFSGVSQVLC